MEVRFIKPDELRKWWPNVRPGLENVKSKTPEDWIPEDIYTDCFTERAMLWALIDNNHPVAYFVLQPNGIYLHIWAAWSICNNELIVIEGLKYIKQIARHGNAQYLTFSSHRRGWDKRAAGLGFKPRQWICEV